MFGASVVTSREADPDWALADHRHNVLSAPPSPSTLQAQVSQVLSRASPELRSTVLNTMRAFFKGQAPQGRGRAGATEVDAAVRVRSMISEGSMPPPYTV